MKHSNSNRPLLFLLQVFKGVALVFCLCWFLSVVPVSAQDYPLNPVGTVPYSGTVCVHASIPGPFNIAVWSERNGQDDLAWSVGGSVFTPCYTEEDRYIIHVYTKDMQWVGAASFFNCVSPVTETSETAAPVQEKKLQAQVSGGNLVISGSGFSADLTVEESEISPSGKAVPKAGFKTDANGAFSLVAGPVGSCEGRTFQISEVSDFPSVIGHVVVSCWYGEDRPVVITEENGDVTVSGIPQGYADRVEADVLAGGEYQPPVVLEQNGGSFTGNIGDTGSFDLEVCDFHAIDVSGDGEVKASSCSPLARMRFAFADALGDPYPGYGIYAFPDTEKSTVEVKIEGAPCSGFQITRTEAQDREVPVLSLSKGEDASCSGEIRAFSGSTVNYNVYRLNPDGSGEFLGRILVSTMSGKVTAAVFCGNSVTVSGTDTGLSRADLTVRNTEGDVVEQVPLSRSSGNTFHGWYVPGPDAGSISVDLGMSTPSDPVSGMAGAVALFNIGTAPVV